MFLRALLLAPLNTLILAGVRPGAVHKTTVRQREDHGKLVRHLARCTVDLLRLERHPVHHRTPPGTTHP